MKIKPFLILLTVSLFQDPTTLPAHHLSDAAKKLQCDIMTDSVTSPGYPLRPENLESCFYLYRATKDEQYLRMGKRMIDDILSKCKTTAGFAAVKDVRSMELEDSMESFFFAETIKYAYLIFAPESTLDLKKTVFTTEAHPLKIAK